jgi:hypothetical protein
MFESSNDCDGVFERSCMLRPPAYNFVGAKGTDGGARGQAEIPPARAGLIRLLEARDGRARFLASVQGRPSPLSLPTVPPTTFPTVWTAPRGL